MPFSKHKKGAIGGITAYVLFAIFILLANLAFYISKEIGVITSDDWLEGTILSTAFVLGGTIIYYIFARNVFNQGKKAGMLERSEGSIKGDSTGELLLGDGYYYDEEVEDIKVEFSDTCDLEKLTQISFDED